MPKTELEAKMSKIAVRIFTNLAQYAEDRRSPGGIATGSDIG